MAVFIAWPLVFPPILSTPWIVLLKDDLHLSPPVSSPELLCAQRLHSIPHYTSSYTFSKFQLKAHTNWVFLAETILPLHEKFRSKLPNFSMNDKIMSINTINSSRNLSISGTIFGYLSPVPLLAFKFKIHEELNSTAFMLSNILSWVSKLNNWIKDFFPVVSLLSLNCYTVSHLFYT